MLGLVLGLLAAAFPPATLVQYVVDPVPHVAAAAGIVLLAVGVDERGVAGASGLANAYLYFSYRQPH